MTKKRQVSSTEEALKKLLDVVECAIKSGDWKVDGACDPDSAIVFAKKALVQPEQEQSGFFSREAMKEHSDFHVAQPAVASEHEKYCSVCQGCGQVDTGIMESPVTICNACNGTGLKAQPAIPQPSRSDIGHKQSTECGEPVAMRYDFDGYGWKYIDSGSGSDWQTRIKDAEPVYTTPPRRKPLTDEQRMKMWRTTKFRGSGGQVDWFIEGTRAAEAAHGIMSDTDGKE